jgi:gluconokinase
MMRRPTQKLAGCLWLARLVDKARLHRRGALPADYQQPFCHPLATDGAFLAHFGLAKEDVLAAIADAGDDDAKIAAWFVGRPEASAERIAAWNALAPNLGREGYPLRRGFLWASRKWYQGAVPDPRVDSVFTGIAFDEGYLDLLIAEVEQRG